MANLGEPHRPEGTAAMGNEIIRLNKVIRALVDRAERNALGNASSDFHQFESTVILEEQVRTRTMELEGALRQNERTTRALRESESKFRSLVNQSVIGIYIIQNDKFSFSNPKLDEMLGYTCEEMRALGPLDVMPARIQPLVAENIRKRLSGELDRVHYLTEGLRKDGTTIDIEIYGNTTEIDEKPALMGLVLDVTERARAEREIQKLQERLRDESIHDPLTGLHNRRYLEETLDRELVAAKRSQHPLTVIMGDLDHFKAINDSFGHLAGDEVLRAFGDLLKRSARGSDVCCRYGGEEFLLVLPQMTAEKAAERAEQLRSDLAARPIVFGAFSIAVTASFGVASFPRHGPSGDALIGAADKALYAAKDGGRNRVIVAS